jgi:hypothetical protein
VLGQVRDVDAARRFVSVWRPAHEAGAAR